MIRINLLPQEERSKKREFKLPDVSTFAIVGIVVLFAAAIGVTAFAQRTKVQGLEHKIAAANEESKRLAPQLAKIKEITREREEVDRRLGIIADLDRYRYYRVKLMSDLSFNLPQNCWLTELSEVTPNQFTIDGVAFSNFTVADIMTNLETSPIVDRIDLKLVEKGKIKEREVMKFKLVANAMPR